MKTFLKRIGLLLLCLLLLQSLAWAGSVLAQEEPPERPPLPPFEEGNGNGGGGDDNDNDDNGAAAPQAPGTGAVSGYVWDYSTVLRPGGVTVVLDGGGWKVETVTDSSGYYRFGGLGSGSAVLNLRLPPGAHPVVFDWPVRVGGREVEVNLGFYWGDGDLLPVTVSGSLQGDSLVAEIHNRMDHSLTGGLLRVLLPADIRGAPSIQASQGFMKSYDSHELEVEVGELAAGKRATVEVPLSPVQVSQSLRQDMPDVKLIFTYDQQQTPIMAAVNPQQLARAQAAPADMAAAPAAPPAAPAQSQQPAAPPARSGQSTSGQQAAPTPSAGQPPDTARPLPETGSYGFTAPGPARLMLAVLTVAGLGLAGLWSARARQ